MSLMIKWLSRRAQRQCRAGTLGAQSGAVGRGPVRILLADDEEAPLLVVKEYLRCCGWEVDAVRSVEEARQLLETRGYSAVITDLRFSGQQSSEGMAIVRLARAHNPQAPVVVMTGYFTPEAEAEARRLGVDAFVPKPVPLWELARLVQGWAAP
jgi:CheY-like chemotaxis protein